ncbi:hypothetical protein FRC09_015317 [Ceratobasidium sp. 395]|nr:hypothetical protein FRC09_015317 [Ceratobasidium sp. 395]
MLVQILAGMKQALGDCHPRTLNAIRNLAISYANQGLFHQAEALQVEVANGRRLRQGVEHPDTLAAFSDLAQTCYDQDRYDEAEVLLVLVLQLRRRVFGLGNEHTIKAAKELADVYSKQGRQEEAEKIRLEVLQYDESVYQSPSPIQVMIESTMSSSNVITHLTAHRCPNVTLDLDITQCHSMPSFTGGFSDIYEGRLLDGAKVAIKCLRLALALTEDQLKNHKKVRFVRSVLHASYMWSKFKHKNVHSLIGLALFRNQIAMVSPWMGCGTLGNYVARNPAINVHDMCAQVVEGLAYVHTQGVIHGDIKGGNILVTESGTPKLTDFGCAALRQDFTIGFTKTGHHFSLRWAAPELQTHDDPVPTTKSDVYALGMTILEVISGQVPYHRAKRDATVMNLVIYKREMPDRPQQIIRDALWNMLRKTWSYEPAERPKLDEVRNIVSSPAYNKS